ncbi:fructose-bisphosphate aldolase, cytoplasmic isozyme 1 [Tanacetum coccineum]|uniref:fructose-bisphosphate aldolase n=1 Tax=Tanacetum coccineum TaxID=301880 RepID=A0ABQ5I707_9ASTR
MWLSKTNNGELATYVIVVRRPPQVLLPTLSLSFLGPCTCEPSSSITDKRKRSSGYISPMAHMQRVGPNRNVRRRSIVNRLGVPIANNSERPKNTILRYLILVPHKATVCVLALDTTTLDIQVPILTRVDKYENDKLAFPKKVGAEVVMRKNLLLGSWKHGIYMGLLRLRRALHSTTLKTWAGKVEDVVAAQTKSLARCMASSKAIYGTYGGSAGVLNSESNHLEDVEVRKSGYVRIDIGSTKLWWRVEVTTFDKSRIDVAVGNQQWGTCYLCYCVRRPPLVLLPTLSSSSLGSTHQQDDSYKEVVEVTAESNCVCDKGLAHVNPLLLSQASGKDPHDTFRQWRICSALVPIEM